MVGWIPSGACTLCRYPEVVLGRAGDRQRERLVGGALEVGVEQGHRGCALFQVPLVRFAKAARRVARAREGPPDVSLMVSAFSGTPSPLIVSCSRTFFIGFLLQKSSARGVPHQKTSTKVGRLGRAGCGSSADILIKALMPSSLRRTLKRRYQWSTSFKRELMELTRLSTKLSWFSST